MIINKYKILFLFAFLTPGCADKSSRNDGDRSVRIISDFPLESISFRQYGNSAPLQATDGVVQIPKSFDLDRPAEIIGTNEGVDLRVLTEPLRQYANGSTISITGLTTAQFALRDQDSDGTLSALEINTEPDESKAASIAAILEEFLRTGFIPGTQDTDSYRLALRLSHERQTLTLLQMLEVNADFLGIDEKGSLAPHHPVCWDDLRATAPVNRKRGYGVHIWHDPNAGARTFAISLLEQMNQQKFCGTAGWALPTAEELQAFPLLASRYYWINADKPVIFDRTSGAIADAGITQANLVFKAWTPMASSALHPPKNQTVEDIQEILVGLRALYQNPNPDTWPKPEVDEGVSWQELGHLPELKKDADSLITLGKRLFFDPRLSQSRAMSCASCHIPNQGWDDNLRTAFGFEGVEGSRNTPSLLNIAYIKDPFWDGRADSLEEQALGPITNPKEMNLPLVQLQARIDAGDFADYGQTLTTNQVAKALAAYERTIVTRGSKFDAVLEGQKSFTDNELWGLHLFRTKAKCMNCHSGPNFTNNEFENIGLANYGQSNQDFGRYNVTSRVEDMGKFRVPTLRELKHTAPYMHTGRFHLKEVLTAYNNAMGTRTVASKLKIGVKRYDSLFQVGSSRLHILNLTEPELNALEAFLGTLSSDKWPLE